VPRTANYNPAAMGETPETTRVPLELNAYIVADPTGWTIETASPKRQWMDATPGKFAYHCLPLVLANQAGWTIPCPVDFSATWNGKPDHDAVTFRFQSDAPRWASQIRSHFGSGILTFSLPWLFRTGTGYGLLVRGPTNYQKDNCVALDGLVETDWAPYTFTMNWRIMRRQTEVWFRKGEPICMLMPYPLNDLDEFKTSISPIEQNQALAHEFANFKHTRDTELAHQKAHGVHNAVRHYIRGRRPDGSEVTDHRTNYKLGKFQG